MNEGVRKFWTPSFMIELNLLLHYFFSKFRTSGGGILHF